MTSPNQTAAQSSSSDDSWESDNSWESEGPPPPLQVKCTDSQCERALHCFRKSRAMSDAEVGACRACGTRLVDWPRVHRRDLADTEHTFAALSHEYVRHHFWHVDIDQKAINHMRRKGRLAYRDDVVKRLRTSLAPANPFRDGYQTPYEGRTVYYAQHAVAACCRTCVAYWHDIPKGRELTEAELEYLAALADRYLLERLPDIADEPINVPRMRRQEPVSEPALSTAKGAAAGDGGDA